jgi:hypothetical protein
VADECLAIVELVTIVFVNRVDAEFIWPIIQYLSSPGVDIDNAPLPYDILINLVVLLANASGSVRDDMVSLMNQLSPEQRSVLSNNVASRLEMLGRRGVLAVNFLIDLGCVDRSLLPLLTKVVRGGASIGRSEATSDRRNIVFENLVSVGMVSEDLKQKLDNSL